MKVRYAVDFQALDEGPRRFQLSGGTFDVPALPLTGDLVALDAARSLHMRFFTSSGGLVSEPDTPILWGRVPSEAPFDYDRLWDEGFHPLLFARVQCKKEELTPAEIIRLQERQNRTRSRIKLTISGGLATITFFAATKDLGGENVITGGAELIRHLLLHS